MLDYARQRIRQALKIPRAVVLATCGPAGLLAGEFPCEAIGLEQYLLIPKTSDHLFNLEHESNVTLLTPKWEMKGSAQVLYEDPIDLNLSLAQDRSAKWCWLVKVTPHLLHIRSEKGWGNVETIELFNAGKDR